MRDILRPLTISYSSTYAIAHDDVKKLVDNKSTTGLGHLAQEDGQPQVRAKNRDGARKYACQDKLVTQGRSGHPVIADGYISGAGIAPTTPSSLPSNPIHIHTLALPNVSASRASVYMSIRRCGDFIGPISGSGLTYSGPKKITVYLIFCSFWTGCVIY